MTAWSADRVIIGIFARTVTAHILLPGTTPSQARTRWMHDPDPLPLQCAQRASGLITKSPDRAYPLFHSSGLSSRSPIISQPHNRLGRA